MALLSFTLPSGNINANELIERQRQKLRPWLLFLQSGNFRWPTTMPRLSRRIAKNVDYFQTNYLCVIIGLILYSLITNPLLLIALLLTLFCGYKLGKISETKQIAILGQILSTSQLYLLAAVCSLPVFYLIGAPKVIFWLIGVSVALISLHASLYNHDAIASIANDARLEEV